MDLEQRCLNLIGTSSFEKEHMFEKVVTPSDVGKLNRLVIPKLYAEKYFPFDSSADEKEGLLLNFEDREGKPWRFRYSYWNSSQSYVITKGWSRFVKDKKLHAGDVVSFHRDVKPAPAGQSQTSRRRLFIDWHHRHRHYPSAPNSSSLPGQLHDGRMLSREQYYRSFGAPQLLYRHGAADVMVRDQQHLGRYYMVGGTGPRTGSVGTGPVVFRAAPIVQEAKRLRLFGVNLDCPVTESDHQIPSGSKIPSIGASLPHQQYEDPAPRASTVSLSLDVNFLR